MAEKSNNPFPLPEPLKEKMGGKKTFVIMGIVIAVLAIALVILLIFGSTKAGKKVIPEALQVGGGVSDISLTTEYENPFDRDTQYVNPFNEFKSPFQALQQ